MTTSADRIDDILLGPIVKAACRIAVRAMTDDELKHEERRLQDRAGEYQSLASQMRREIKRRKRKLRQAIARANEGE